MSHPTPPPDSTIVSTTSLSSDPMEGKQTVLLRTAELMLVKHRAELLPCFSELMIEKAKLH